MECRPCVSLADGQYAGKLLAGVVVVVVRVMHARMVSSNWSWVGAQRYVHRWCRCSLQLPKNSSHTSPSGFTPPQTPHLGLLLLRRRLCC